MNVQVMRRLCTWGLALGVVLIGGLGAPQGLNFAEASASQPTLQSVTVAVQVTDCETQAPIQGAKVTVVDTTQDNKALAEGSTDAEGKFSTVVLVSAASASDAADKLGVVVEKTGFVVQSTTKSVLIFLGTLVSFNVCMTGSAQPPVECTATLQAGQPIQQALDQAQEGAVICLEAGTYPVSSSYTVNKGLSLVGLGARPEEVVLRGDRAEPVVVIEAQGKVLITNLTVREGSGAGPTERGGGVHIINSQDVTLRRVILTENQRFGLLTQRSQVTVEDSQVLNTQAVTAPLDGQGILSRGSAVQIKKTTLRGNGAEGVAARDTLVLSFSDEERASQVTVEESIIEQNAVYGLSVLRGSELAVRRSRILNTRSVGGSFGDGVFALGWGRLILEDNVIEGNAGLGLLLAGDVQATLRGNQIRRNSWGVIIGISSLIGETVQAEFFNNTITQNTNCGVFISRDEGITIRGSGNTITGNGRAPSWNICGATGKVPPGF